jgi:hypothetical protein
VLHESQKYVDICDETRSNLKIINFFTIKATKKIAVDSFNTHVSVIMFEYKIHRKDNFFFGKYSRGPTSLKKECSKILWMEVSILLCLLRHSYSFRIQFFALLILVCLIHISFLE